MVMALGTREIELLKRIAGTSELLTERQVSREVKQRLSDLVHFGLAVKIILFRSRPNCSNTGQKGGRLYDGRESL